MLTRFRSASGQEEFSFAVNHHRTKLIKVIQRRRQGIRELVVDLPMIVFEFVTRASYEREQVPDDLRRSEEESSFAVSFAEMQRLRLRKLQWKLAEHAVEIQCDGKEPDT